MSHWLYAYLLPAWVAIPLLGALFIGVMPHTDRTTLRHAGLGISVLTGLAGFVVVWLQSKGLGVAPHRWVWGDGGGGLVWQVNRADLPLLLGIGVLVPVCLRGGAPRIAERTQGYVALVLITEALSLAAVLAKTVVWQLLFLDLTALPLLLLIAIFGGPLRGSATMRIAVVWLLADFLAIGAATWLAATTSHNLFATMAELRQAAEAVSGDDALLAFAALSCAGWVRLAVVPFASWLVPLFDEAPVSAASLAVATTFPLGALTLHRACELLPDGAMGGMWFGLAATTLSALLAGAVALVERDLRRLIAAAVSFHGAVGALGLLFADLEAAPAVMVYLPAMAAGSVWALFVVEAIERRYYTRDSVDLLGLSRDIPGLWRLFAAAFISTVGIPTLAGGSLWIPLLTSVSNSAKGLQSGVPPNAIFWCVALVCVGWTGIATGTVIVLKRLASPSPRQASRTPIPFTVPQALRLWLPALWVFAVGVSSPWWAQKLGKSTTATPPRPAQVVSSPGSAQDASRSQP